MRQDKGQTPKEPAFSIPPCESSTPVVVGPVEGACSEADPNTSSQMEEWAEVVGGECLTDRSDIEEIDAVGMEKDNPWAEMVEADNLLGLEREDIEASDQPLPNLAEGKEEARVLASQQKEDGSLAEMRRMGDEQTNGFIVDENGVLVQLKLITPGKEVKRVVVPTPRRKEILDVTHRGLVGGHYSHDKTSECLLQHFFWPGLRRDVKKYCAACSDCQRVGRVLRARVPLMKTPIISTPYQRLAADLVGPLERTKSGFRYILTVMCVGTRFPYAIPLKKIDAESVAEGLIEVISQTGIPQELLTDQGSVFVGTLVRQVCNLLSIKKIRTTAYHPQTNGILERCHASLKGMMRKLGNEVREWDKALKFCLLCYRGTPHTATGFSPFQLVHGYPMRGPLEAWMAGRETEF